MKEIPNNKFLNDLADSLEIADDTHTKAEKRYESLGEWLSRDMSTIKSFEPEIYSQGSIRLGTVIKPLNSEDEYDLDAVCVLKSLNVLDITQKNLKNLIGLEVQAYAKANGMKKDIIEAKRCWTLEYSDSAQFHMDILPAIPDEDGLKELLESKNINDYSNLNIAYAISITDNTKYNYNSLTKDWNKSNPKGYYEWFKKRMEVKYKSFSNRIAVASESVEEIPIHDKKTPLQKSIMILKRHRDIMYQNNKKHQPISIIITTLAAQAYSGEEQLSEALKTIITNIEDGIEFKDGRYVITNPVNPLENFADKWEFEPIKQEEFSKWITKLRQDYNYLISIDYMHNRLSLESAFGEKAIAEIYDKNNIQDSALDNIKNKLFSLLHVKKPQWIMNKIGKVKIVCHKSRNGMRVTEINSNTALSKHWELRFEAIVSNNIDTHSRKIYWQVANSGNEAAEAKSLRGGFYEGDINKGGKVRKEDTLYIGYHFVKCFVIQNNQCVAESEPFIVNIV